MLKSRIEKLEKITLSNKELDCLTKSLLKTPNDTSFTTADLKSIYDDCKNHPENHPKNAINYE